MKVYPYRLISDRAHGLSSDARSNSLVAAVMALILLLGCNPIDAAELRAFPGAEGFGAKAAGGRGGRVIEVTNLNDSGAGSLRACVIATGPRTCVFRTGGTIIVNTPLDIRNPFITIAGQTAPGGGITLRNSTSMSSVSLSVRTNDVIIRHIRLRPGAAPVLNSGVDGMRITEGATKVIVDHSSFSWATDENLAVSGVRDITVQRSIVSEGLSMSTHDKGEHSKGINISNKVTTLPIGNLSFHHNLLAHNNDRNPEGDAYDTTDWVNNIIYNYGQHASRFANRENADSPVNFVGNFYKKGVDSPNDVYEVEAGETGAATAPSFFVLGNIGPHRTSDAQAENLVVDPADRGLVTSIRHPALTVTTTSATQALEDVLANAGASRPRLDAVDKRIIEEVRRGEGKIIDCTSPTSTPGCNTKVALTSNDYTKYGINDPIDSDGWPILAAGTPPTDTDHDGMPNEWEQQYGFSLSSATDGAADADLDGYTNLEEFLNGTDPEVPDTDVPPGGDTTPPTVSITEPVSTATLSGMAVLKADATDSGGSGIAGVQFKLDSNNLGPEDKTPPYSFSWDTTTVADGAHTLTSVARDAEGNSATALPITVIVNNQLPSQTTFNFTPVADATIKRTEPTKNFGKASKLHVDNSPVLNFLMKFSVSGIGTKQVTSAKLRLYSADPADKGGKFQRVANNSWSEQTVTWNNAPVADTAVLASFGSVTTNKWYEVDIKSLITRDGTYSIKATSPSSDSAAFHSKESAGFAPKLVVTAK